MKKRAYTGLKDAKGRKLYEGDTIAYTYTDSCEPNGIGTNEGVIVFENAAFVVKEPSYKGYDWRFESTRPFLLWEWLLNNRCFRPTVKNGKHPVSKTQNL